MPGSDPQILAALESLGHVPDSVAAIVITHAHVDHAGSALALRQATGAPVLAHRSDAGSIVQGVSAPVRGRTPELAAMVERMGAAMTPPFPGFEPDILVDDEYSLESLGLAARLIHVPGHTEGGMAVLLADGQAIVGDLIAASSADPAIPVLGPFATDVDAMVASVHRILSLEPIRVYCGHDGPFEAEALRSLVE